MSTEIHTLVIDDEEIVKPIGTVNTTIYFVAVNVIDRLRVNVDNPVTY